VLLSEKAWLTPGKSQLVKVKVEQSSVQESSPDEVGVITPEERILAGQSCNFVTETVHPQLASEPHLHTSFDILRNLFE